MSLPRFQRGFIDVSQDLVFDDPFYRAPKARPKVAFNCPRCNSRESDEVHQDEGGTDVVHCSNCNIDVSMLVLGDIDWERDKARRAFINQWAGWGVDVV